MDRIKPLNDFIFKKLFGEEDSKGSLIALLNAILRGKDKEKLVSLEIINNKELTRDLIDDKTGILDVRAKTSDGTQLDIEVQLTDQNNMDKRTMWYWGRIFNEGIRRGEDYNKLTKVITINILQFEYINIPDKFHTSFHLWEDDVKDYMLTDLIEIHFIDMNKFRKLENKNLKEDKLQRWLTFFDQDISEEKLRELIEMDEDIKIAEEKIEYLSSDPAALEAYRARENSLHERANMISTAISKGKAEGIALGKLQGETKGKYERSIEIAKNLIKLGMETAQIAEITKLNIDELEEIRGIQTP